MEIASIKNTKMLVDTLQILGMEDKVNVVLNRSTMESVVKASDVPELLEAESLMYIPNDFQIVSQSLNTGIPFVLNQGKTDVSKAVFKIAEQLISRREISVFNPKSVPFLQSLFHRKNQFRLS